LAPPHRHCIAGPSLHVIGRSFLPLLALVGVLVNAVAVVEGKIKSKLRQPVLLIGSPLEPPHRFLCITLNAMTMVKAPRQAVLRVNVVILHSLLTKQLDCLAVLPCIVKFNRLVSNMRHENETLSTTTKSEGEKNNKNRISRA
jgi:hypothetical protein